MNNLLQLKGRFNQVSRNNPNWGPANVPTGESVKVSRLEKLKEDLLELLYFWDENPYLDTVLIDVHYRRVIAKSNRIGYLLKQRKLAPNDSVVGAKYASDASRAHIITHNISTDGLKSTISNITEAIKVLKDYFLEEITHDDMNNLKGLNIPFGSKIRLSRSSFMQLIKDAYYVVGFDVPNTYLEETSQIVTIYNVTEEVEKLLNEIGIYYLTSFKLDKNTFLLSENQIKILNNEAPYLVSMATKDISELDLSQILEKIDSTEEHFSIPESGEEPIVGVIDTLFDDRVYFSDWVDFHDMVDVNFERMSISYEHGTAVSSIIVDGPSLNPDLDDGCGRFRVRHFGVTSQNRASSFSIVKQIEKIVVQNPDIKVWNFSLGSIYEINENSISAEGAVLDRLQKEHDIIFIVSGTNDNENTGVKSIGSPADSLNSIVVNSVTTDGKSASYTRNGPVLSFFNKPDVSYYGGDDEQLMRVCKSTGEGWVSGTSYAAPWIARKAAYLIHIMGFSREITKALIIDSAIKWENEMEGISQRGYGVVPIRIEEVIQGNEDEIKFILSGTSEKFKTYNYNLPVPSYKDKHPYITKATMCYFPNCTRSQGVDYTDLELVVKFGRIDDNGKIKSVDDDRQLEPGNIIYEEEARGNFRKWDNVKHIREIYTSRKRDKKKYANGNWGIEISRTSRLDNGKDKTLDFGLVVTLKEIHGVNRIDSFIQQCSLQGWLVNQIDIEQQVEIYNEAQVEIEFE